MVITNAVVHTGRDGVIPNGFVAWEGERILGIGTMNALCLDHGQVWDAQGGHVSPGFIDAHTHLGLFPDGGPYDETRLNADCPVAPAFSPVPDLTDRAFAEALEAGVTAAVTGPGSKNPVGGQMFCLKTADGCGRARLLYDDPAGLKLALGETPEKTTGLDADGLMSLIRTSFAQAKDGPLAAARGGRLPVHVHVHRASDIALALALKEEFELWMVLVHGTGGHLMAEAVAGAGVGVVTGPAMTDRSRSELKCLCPEGPALLAQAGVRVSICTDHPETPAKLLPLCAALAVRGGMDREEALKAITWHPALELGLGYRMGALVPGMDADLVLTPGHPLDPTVKPTAVFVNGRRVV